MKASFERGSVIVWILIAVALFAALGFAMMQGSDSSTSMIMDESDEGMARMAVSDGNTLQQAVRRISLLGTADTAISFENTTDTAYTNAACTKAKCKVYDSAGGGVNWTTYSTKLNDGSGWLFSTNRINNVGNTGTTDLIAFLPNIKINVCKKINEIVGFGTAGANPPQESNTVDLTKFTGAYGSTVMDDGGSLFEGKLQGCFQGGGTPSNTSYYYFQVLLAR